MPGLHHALAVALFALVTITMLRGQTPAPPAAACTVCTDATIECPTCKGAGTQSVDCWLCGADGSVACVRCPKQSGTVDCPNPVCHDGQTVWDLGDKDPCKLCKAKGTLQCPECRGKPRATCTLCTGKGKRARTCSTCSGGKRIPCPICKPPANGSGCIGTDVSGRTACRLCPKDDKGTHACIACSGTGGLVCETCQGLARLPCTTCGASGKMRLASERYRGLPAGREKAGMKQCDRCEGDGLGQRCPACKGGRRDCAACDAGKAPRTCTACLFQGTLACEACVSGGHARLELLGLWALDHGFPRQAERLLERAVQSAQQMDGPRPITLGLDAELRLLQAKLQRGPLAASRPAGEDPRATLELEVLLPSDLRQWHWPNPPHDHALSPWIERRWLQAHRERTVNRLEKALVRAREAAAPAGK